MNNYPVEPTLEDVLQAQELTLKAFEDKDIDKAIALNRISIKIAQDFLFFSKINCNPYLYYKLNDDKTISPCSMREYADQLEHMRATDTKHIAKDDIGEYWISTVWLGLNHSHHEEGLPLLFETMVFKGKEGDVYCDRYSTWDDAIAGHKEIKNKVATGEIK